MFRVNEAALVGGVLERRDEPPAMAHAALELWLAAPEHPGHADTAAQEVWGALRKAGAAQTAIDLGLRAIRDGKLLRPHAFIDIVEATPDPQVRLELAAHVLDAGWPVQPYLATIFFALVDAGEEDALWRFMRVNAERLASTTPGWTLVGWILNATRIGRKPDLEAWIAGFDARPAVPMWVVAAFLVNLALREGIHGGLGQIARAALQHCVPDATQAYLVAQHLAAELRAKRFDAFRAGYREHAAIIVPTLYAIEHPMVAYANAAKHVHAVAIDEFTFTFDAYRDASVATAIRTAGVKRPTNWRLILHLQEYDPLVRRAAAIFPVFAEMLDVKPRSPRAMQLYREMSKSRPSDLGVALVWKEFAEARLSWLQRLRLEYF